MDRSPHLARVAGVRLHVRAAALQHGTQPRGVGLPRRCGEAEAFARQHGAGGQRGGRVV